MGRNPDRELRGRWEEAKARGDKIFDIGIPCIHGHLEGRRVQPHRHPCITCSRNSQIVYAKTRYHSDEGYRKRLIIAIQKWRVKNPDKVKEYQKRQRERDKAKK